MVDSPVTFAFDAATHENDPPEWVCVSARLTEVPEQTVFELALVTTGVAFT